MTGVTISENYWQEFEIVSTDIEHLYNYLLDVETPLTSEELLQVLVKERIRSEVERLEKQRSAGGEIYYPRESYGKGAKLVFPALGWQHGKVVDVRPGKNPELPPFDVISVELSNGDKRDFAAGVGEHVLNQIPELPVESDSMSATAILDSYRDDMIETLEEALESNSDFVRIAGKWFPIALMVDISIGHLNLAEAVLDMAGGGPLTTGDILAQVDMGSTENPKLVEFSFDYYLDKDNRFDEVGPSGQVLWYLQRLEPAEVLNTPLYLRYHPVDYDHSVLSPEMHALEAELDDEYSSLPPKEWKSLANEASIVLIFPHWQAGTLPLSSRVRKIFPSAYEAPRVRFILVDGDTGERFPGWVVRNQRYVYGLKEWYQSRGLGPGSIVKISVGKNPGEVIVQAGTRRSSRDWMRTVLVGTDSGIVFAMLRQVVQAEYDERMALAIPDVGNLDKLWQRPERQQPMLERVIVDMARELTKLNPQGHVHASEVYAAVNMLRRCPPGPILSVLASRPWFTHVGDLHFRFDDSEQR